MEKIFNFIKKNISGFGNFFSEKSPLSMMRFMSFFMFWFAIYEIDVVIRTYGSNIQPNHIVLIGILLTFAFFPKVAQKIIEKKYDALEKEVKQEPKSEPEV